MPLASLVPSWFSIDRSRLTIAELRTRTFPEIPRPARVHWRYDSKPRPSMNLDTAAIRRLRDHFVEVDAAHIGSSSTPPDAVAQAVLRRAEPFAETMYLVMMADGSAGEEEQKALVGALHVLTHGAAAGDAAQAMFDRFAQNLATFGAHSRLQQIGARLSAQAQDRETAFSLGAMVALADDNIDWRESELIHHLAEFYGVSDRRIEALLQAFD